MSKIVTIPPLSMKSSAGTVSGDVSAMRKGFLRRTLDLAHATDVFAYAASKRGMQPAADSVTGSTRKEWDHQVDTFGGALILTEAMFGNPVALGTLSAQAGAALGDLAAQGTVAAAKKLGKGDPQALESGAEAAHKFSQAIQDLPKEAMKNTTLGQVLVACSLSRGNFIASIMIGNTAGTAALEYGVRGAAAIERKVKGALVTPDVKVEELEKLFDAFKASDDFNKAVLAGFADRILDGFQGEMLPGVQSRLETMSRSDALGKLKPAQAALAKDLGEFYYGLQMAVIGDDVGAKSLEAFNRMPDFVKEDLQPVLTRVMH